MILGHILFILYTLFKMDFTKVPKNTINKWEKFWKLTATWKRKREKVKWDTRVFRECICECWKVCWWLYANLKRWQHRSCWCLAKRPRIHWKANSRIYNIWNNIKLRCNYVKHKSYPIYWWRWISICEEWNKSFKKFYEDMWASYEAHCAEFWEANTTIDRIDVNWNYCKENCRRATRKEQRKNQRGVTFSL